MRMRLVLIVSGSGLASRSATTVISKRAGLSA